MKKYILICSLFLSSCVFSWDGKRQGFVLGLGLGLGSLEYKGIISSQIPVDERTREVTTFNFLPKIGYAFTDRFALLLFQNSFFFETKNSQQKKELFTAGSQLIGFNYYFSESAPSFYLGLGFGEGSFYQGEDEDTASTIKGDASFFSLGYECQKHFSVELAVTTTIMDNSKGEFVGGAIFLNVLGY